MHLTMPIEIREEKVVTLYDSENKPVISTDGYVNKQLLKEMIHLFNKTEKVKFNVKE